MTGGVHWADSIVLTGLCLAGASIVSYLGWLKSGARDGLPEFVDKNISTFHGFGPLGWMLTLMMALTVCQLIPLPLALLDVLSPQSSALYREAYALTGMDRSWGMLTACPGRTAFALWGLIGYWGIYVMSLRLGATRNSVLKLSHYIVVAGVVFLGMMVLKDIAYPISLGGTGENAAWHIGFPVNENHIAGVMGFLSTMSLGAFFSRRHRHAGARKGLWLLFYVLFGVAVVMLKSRGGIMAWGIGQVIVCAYAFARSRGLGWKTGCIILGALGAVIAIVLTVSASTIGQIKTEFEETHLEASVSEEFVGGNDFVRQHDKLSKTQLYGDFWRMGQDWGRLGTGRSAFYDVYPVYQSFSFPKHFRHAENEYWEVLLEYGWFWGSVCLILGLWGILLFVRAFWGHKEERGVMFGLLAGVIALGTQNIFDFGLRYWTGAFPFWMACGILEARRLRWIHGRVDKDEPRITRYRKVEWIVVNAIALGALITAVVVLPMAIDGMRESGLRKMNALIVKNSSASSSVDELIKKNIAVRPGSANLRRIVGNALIADARAAKTEDERREVWKRARVWFESAISRAPRNADAQLKLAKLCYVLGDETCAADYYLKAIENDYRLTSVAMYEMSVLGGGSIRLPQERDAQLSLVNSLLERGRYDVVLNLMNGLKDADPVYSAAIECQVYRKMGFDDGCDSVIETLAGQPMTILLFELHADSLVRQKKYDELITFIVENESGLSREKAYWRRRMFASAYYGHERGDAWYRREVTNSIEHFKKLSGTRKSEVFDIALCEAQYALELEQFSRAIRSAGNALEIRPGNKQALLILDAAKERQALRIDGKNKK